MRRFFRSAACIGLLAVVPALLAREGRKRSTLPAYILSAHSVAVVIDPDAGHTLRDPDANRVAQRDVEAALANWNRYELTSPKGADLLIVVRRGTGKAADVTMKDPSQNNRPGSIQPIDGGVILGGQSTSARKAPTAPQAEFGNEEDSFVVVQGLGVLGNSIDDALESTAGWRMQRRDALKPHSVPAVDAFRKAVAEAEQAAAKP